MTVYQVTSMMQASSSASTAAGKIKLNTGRAGKTSNDQRRKGCPGFVGYPRASLPACMSVLDQWQRLVAVLQAGRSPPRFQRVSCVRHQGRRRKNRCSYRDDHGRRRSQDRHGRQPGDPNSIVEVFKPGTWTGDEPIPVIGVAPPAGTGGIPRLRRQASQAHLVPAALLIFEFH